MHANTHFYRKQPCTNDNGNCRSEADTFSILCQKSIAQKRFGSCVVSIHWLLIIQLVEVVHCHQLIGYYHAIRNIPAFTITWARWFASYVRFRCLKRNLILFLCSPFIASCSWLPHWIGAVCVSECRCQFTIFLHTFVWLRTFINTHLDWLTHTHTHMAQTRRTHDIPETTLKRC